MAVRAQDNALGDLITQLRFSDADPTATADREEFCAPYVVHIQHDEILLAAVDAAVALGLRDDFAHLPLERLLPRWDEMSVALPPPVLSSSSALLTARRTELSTRSWTVGLFGKFRITVTAEAHRQIVLASVDDECA